MISFYLILSDSARVLFNEFFDSIDIILELFVSNLFEQIVSQDGSIIKFIELICKHFFIFIGHLKLLFEKFINLSVQFLKLLDILFSGTWDLLLNLCVFCIVISSLFEQLI